MFGPLSTFATTYNCVVRMSKLQLKLNEEFTTLTIRDFQTGEFYYDGVIKETIEQDGRTELIFEADSHSLIQFQFLTEALKREDNVLFGFVRGHHLGGFFDQSLRCIKNEEFLN